MSASEFAPDEFHGHEALISELRAGTLDAPDHLHRRVLAGRSVKQRRFADMSGRRRAFLVVPVAATLAVGAAVVHGAFYSGSNPHHSAGARSLMGKVPSSHQDGRPTSAPSGPSGPSYVTGAKGPTASHTRGAPGNYSAQGEKSLARLNAARAAQSANDAVTIPKGRRVNAAATLQVAVANRLALTHATNKAMALVTQLGGYTQSSDYQDSREGQTYGSAILELRVPVGKAEDAITALDGLGTVVSQQVTTKDLQQTYAKQTDVIGQLRRAIAIYEQALASGTLSGSQRVNVQIQLSEAQYQLKATVKGRKRTILAAATAEIKLTLTTKGHQAVIVHPGKRGRLGRLLHNAGGFLALEGIVVLYALIVIAPIAILVGLMWGLARERRRREERLLANA